LADALLPEETLRVHADDERYFVVHVAANREAMLATMTELGYEPHPELVASCYAASSENLDGLLGVLWFSHEWIGGGVVAHEMGHAAFRALEAVGVTVDHARESPDDRFSDQYRATSTEERYCETLERLVREFWNEWYDRNPGANDA
jgi:hypothetical protein